MDSKYGPLALRLSLGLLFFISGLKKLTAPEGFADMMGQWGFPLATVLAWIVIITEVLAGASLLSGFKTKYGAGLLFTVLLVATLVVVLGTADSVSTALASSNFWWHIVGMTGMFSLYVTGPGAFAVDTNKGF